MTKVTRLTKKQITATITQDNTKC